MYPKFIQSKQTSSTNVSTFCFRESFSQNVSALFYSLQTLAALYFEPRCPPSGWILKSRRMSQGSQTQKKKKKKRKLCFMDKDNMTELCSSPLICLSHTDLDSPPLKRTTWSLLKPAEIWTRWSEEIFSEHDKLASMGTLKPVVSHQLRRYQPCVMRQAWLSAPSTRPNE